MAIKIENLITFADCKYEFNKENYNKLIEGIKIMPINSATVVYLQSLFNNLSNFLEMNGFIEQRIRCYPEDDILTLCQQINALYGSCIYYTKEAYS